MAAVHFVERTDNVRKLDKSKNEWESGYWALSEDTAQKLVGSVLYLHRTKQQSSHFGGDILAYRVEQSGPHAGRIVFTVRANSDYKNVKTDGRGWSKDSKVLWDAVPAKAQ